MEKHLPLNAMLVMHTSSLITLVDVIHHQDLVSIYWVYINQIIIIAGIDQQLCDGVECPPLIYPTCRYVIPWGACCPLCGMYKLSAHNG